MSYKSPLTVDIADTSPTLDLEPSQPSPHCVEPKLELTADGEPEPTATYEPSHGRATELTIAPEPVISDQLRKPATELGTGESTARAQREAPPTVPWLRVSSALWTVCYLPFSRYHLPVLKCLSAFIYIPIWKNVAALNRMPVR